jgi:gliding motility-associated-like protein
MPGEYEACLIVTSSNGCTDTLCQMVNIDALPTGGFIYDNPGCEMDLVTFTSTASTDVVSCQYNFGDGNLSAFCNPQHPFNNPGIFAVTQVVENAAGCKNSFTDSIRVGALPIPDFEINILNNCHPAEVSFTNTSANAQGYLWDFGNGMTSTETNPTIVYEIPDPYMVVLTAFNDSICQRSKSSILDILETPNAAFSLSSNVLCANDSVTFTNGSTGGGSLDWQWDFGDGIFSFATNPIHVYATSGSFTVTLIADNGSCQDTFRNVVLVNKPVLASAFISNLICFSDETGAIDLNLLSGSAPFNFSWSNNAVTEDQSGLSAGVYSVTITDANTCTWDSAVQVTQPTELSVQITEQQIVSCFGGNDGKLCIEPNGGVPDYQIIWDNGLATPCLEDMAAGDYNVSITDMNGCVLQETMVILENAAIDWQADIEHISCFGEMDGVIRINNVLGGVPPFDISILGPDGFTNVGGTHQNLSPGEYTIVINDLLGCESQFDVLIDEPDSLWMYIQEDTIQITMGDTYEIRVNHNAFNPSFYWSPSDSLSCTDCEEPIANPTRTTVYSLLLTDENGCTQSDNLIVLVDKQKHIRYPNVFTPNDDGVDDRYFLLSAYPQAIRQINVFRIFDQWGELLYEAKGISPNDYSTGWDGYFKTDVLAPGTYVFYAEIEYVDGDVVLEKSEFLLLR